MPRLGVGRHFVALQPGAFGHLGDSVEHGIGHVVFGNHRREFGEVGVGLNRQVVNRNMRWLQRQRLAHVLLQVFQRLAGQRIHDVEVEGVKSLRRLFNRRNRLGAVMHAAQRLEVAVVKTLHANRKAVHAGAAKGLEAVFFKGAGVGLQRDLAIGLQPQPRANITQQAINRLRRKQAGRAAAYENAVHRAAPDQWQRGFQIGHHGIDVALLRQFRRLARQLMRIEVAIRAFFQAPG